MLYDWAGTVNEDTPPVEEQFSCSPEDIHV